MSLKTQSNGHEYEKHPAGMFAARCYQVIDLGTHFDERWGKSKHLVRIVFETSEKMADGRPFSIGTRYTMSHHEKSQLRKDLESWYGKTFDSAALDREGGFDLFKILGRAAMLNISHSADGKYANIKSINPVPKGMPVPEAVNEPLIFDIENFDLDLFNKLGKKTQEMIEKSEERTGEGRDKKIPPPASAPAEPDIEMPPF